MAQSGSTDVDVVASEVEESMKQLAGALIHNDLIRQGTRVLVLLNDDPATSTYTFDHVYSLSARYIAKWDEKDGQTYINDLAVSNDKNLVQHPGQVRAVVQTLSEVGFAISRLNSNNIVDEHEKFVFLFAPHLDALILPQANTQVATVKRLNNDPAHPQISSADHTIFLTPGCWSVTVDDLSMVIRVLPRSPALLIMEPAADHRLMVRQVQQGGCIPMTGQSEQGHVIGRPARLDSLEDHQSISLPGTMSHAEYGLTQHKNIHQDTRRKLILAADHRSGTTIVAKIMAIKDWSDIEKWFREYHIHKCLDHPSIVKLRFGDARYCTLNLEHIAGSDLASNAHCQNMMSTLPRPTVNRIFRDLAAALRYLADRNIEHHDINPSNVLFCADRGAVLCDFSSATTPWHGANPDSGTAHYLPPEFIGTGSRGLAGDVYAAGIVMLFLLGKILSLDRMRNPSHPSFMNLDAFKVRHGVPFHRLQIMLIHDGLEAVAVQLDATDSIELLVQRMLAKRWQDRITAVELDRVLNSPNQASQNTTQVGFAPRSHKEFLGA